MESVNLTVEENQPIIFLFFMMFGQFFNKTYTVHLVLDLYRYYTSLGPLEITSPVMSICSKLIFSLSMTLLIILKLQKMSILLFVQLAKKSSQISCLFSANP